MKIVVTGATSFIGVPAIHALLGRGCEVYAVIRPGSANRTRLPECMEGLHIVEMKMEELDCVTEKIPGSCDGFFHFGWDGSGSDNRTNRKVQQKNVDDSLKALEGAAKLGCKRFIFSGSQAEYGIHQGAMMEATECIPVSEYGKAKVEFHEKASAFCRGWQEEGRGRIEYIHTRIFSIYGPGDHPWSLVESCLDAFTGEREIQLGECTQMWNFLYIDDLIDALLALLLHEGMLYGPAERGYCLDGGIPADQAMTEGVFNIAGGRDATRPLRDYVGDMYRLCGERGSFHYGTRPPNAEGPANLIPDITRLEAVTGWRPQVSFDEGIRRMLKIRQSAAAADENKRVGL